MTTTHVCTLVLLHCYLFSQHINFHFCPTVFHLPSPHLKSHSFCISVPFCVSLSIHLFSIMSLSLTPCRESDTQTQTPPSPLSSLAVWPSYRLSSSPAFLPLLFSHFFPSSFLLSVFSCVSLHHSLFVSFVALLCSLLYLLLLRSSSSLNLSFFRSPFILHPLPVHFFLFLQNLSSPSTFIFLLFFCVRPLKEFALRMYFGVAQPAVIFQWVSVWVMLNVSVCAFFSSFVLKNDVPSL